MLGRISQPAREFSQCFVSHTMTLQCIIINALLSIVWWCLMCTQHFAHIKLFFNAEHNTGFFACQLHSHEPTSQVGQSCNQPRHGRDDTRTRWWIWRHFCFFWCGKNEIMKCIYIHTVCIDFSDLIVWNCKEKTRASRRSTWCTYCTYHYLPLPTLTYH